MYMGTVVTDIYGVKTPFFCHLEKERGPCVLSIAFLI